MSRYRGPAVKISRREGVNLTETAKVQRYLDRHPYPPGQHGQRRRRKPSDYAVRLREKQKLRFYYGMSEKQFRNLFDEATRQKGSAAVAFLQLLESRLDNIVFRLGLALTRRQARQFVSHGFITVNGKVVDIPSYRLRPGDEVSLIPRMRKNTHVLGNVAERQRIALPQWLDFNPDTFTGVFKHVPEREDIPVPVNELLVVEYYSR